MVSRREGQSDFLETVVDKIASKESECVKKVASTNHPAEKAAAIEAKTASTNHPAEKVATAEVIDNTASVESTEKIAEESAEKSASTNHPATKVSSETITLHQARVARREGKFVKVAGRNDLYQEAETKSYWKIVGSTVVREFEEQNGIAKA